MSFFSIVLFVFFLQTLPLDLLGIGFKNQLCVDFSDVVIKEMASRYASADSIRWLVEEIRNIFDLVDASFDVVIDKCTLDTMISAVCGILLPKSGKIQAIVSTRRVVTTNSLL
jgi:hypothetical protein